jgi:hypothetical protein
LPEDLLLLAQVGATVHVSQDSVRHSDTFHLAGVQPPSATEVIEQFLRFPR